MSKKIVFFDFDGTITTDDSLLKFIRFVVGDRRFLLGLVFFISNACFIQAQTHPKLQSQTIYAILVF